MEKGNRIGAILGADPKTKVIKVLGYGTYDGEFRPEDWPIENPRLTLDNGQVVWGYECWWGPEEIMKQKLETWKEQGYTIKEVDIEVERYRVTESQ